MKSLAFSIFILTALSLASQTNIKIGEVYDYNVSDEFHHVTRGGSTGSNNPPGYRTTTILNKFFSGPDTVYYHIKWIQSHLPNIPGSWVTTSGEDTIMYSSLDSNISGIDYSYIDTNEYNGRRIYVDTAWGFDTGYENNYVKGLGEVYLYYTDGITYGKGSLVYYKKGNETWGNRLHIGIEDVISKHNLKVFPNPSNGRVFVQTDNNDNIQKLQVLNLYGENVFQKIFSSQSNSTEEIDLSFLPNGVYIIAVVSDNSTFTTNIYLK